MAIRRKVMVATVILFGWTAAAIGGSTLTAGADDFVVDDQYAQENFAGAWHRGQVDFFDYQCHPGITCRPFDANITVHDRSGDRTVCTDLEARYGGQRWTTVATVCRGNTQLIELRNVGTLGGDVRFRISIEGIGHSKPVLCRRNGDGTEPCR